MAGIRLVTRADDAGLNITSNKAVRASVRQGIVRNISLLAPAPEIDHAAEILADLADQADFGLHVCLTSEWANLRWGSISEPTVVSSLLRSDNSFPATYDEFAASSPNIGEMMVEVQAQYELLMELGFTLSYIDTHMGVGRVSQLHDELKVFAREKDLVYDRQLLEAGSFTWLPGWDGPGEHPGTELADHLATVPAGTYRIVGHPAFKTEEMRELRFPGKPAGEHYLPRNRQRRMFADIEIVDYCENVGIELVRYSQLRS